MKYADINVINNIIASSQGNDISYNSIYALGNNLYSVDQDILFNFSSQYDWGNNNLNSYISGVNSNGAITAKNCPANCSRCSSAIYNTCYQCISPFKLVANTCISTSGFYLKTPPATITNQYVSLKIVDPTKNINIPNENALTITFWMKFYGVISTPTSICPVILIINKPLNTFICYEFKTKTLILYYNSLNIVFSDSSFFTYLGEWVLISISNYMNTSSNSLYFPNMLDLFIQKNNIPRGSKSIPSPGISISNLDIGYEIIALFSDLRVYNTYLIGAFATVTGITTTQSIGLIMQKTFSGSSSSDCITSNDLNSQDPITMGILCATDYNPYLDSTLLCNDNNKYLKYENKTMTCSKCDVGCTTKCYDSLNSQCSCNYSDGFYWIRRSKSKIDYCESKKYN